MHPKMLQFATLLFLVLAAASAAPSNETFLEEVKLDSNTSLPSLYIDKTPRIILGSPAASGQFPWQVALYPTVRRQTYFNCGGALISPRWILTAAHCVDEEQLTAIKVYLGVTSLENPSGRVTANARYVIKHPNWDSKNLDNDIALIMLWSPVRLSKTVKPIPMATQWLGPYVPVTISGWGRTSDKSSHISQNLNYVGLTTITNSECSYTFWNVYYRVGIVCARGATIQSTCSGDSGGALVAGSGSEAVHVGIVSFGSGKGCAKGYPTAFTRTAYYRDWIRSVTGI